MKYNSNGELLVSDNGSSVGTPINLIQLPLISNTTEGAVTAIAAVAGKQIRVFMIKFTLKGEAKNIVLVKNGATTIDQHILSTEGDTSGYLAEVNPVYVLSTNTALNLDFSSTSEVVVKILYDLL